jgi:hypothetical protein
LKNSLSDFANEVALLKTTLTPHFNEQSLPSNSTNLQTHNGYHYQDLSHTHQNKIVSHTYLLITTTNQTLCFSSLPPQRRVK